MSANLREESFSNNKFIAIRPETHARRIPKPKRSIGSSAVLIADPDPANLFLLAKLIEEEGFTVVIASDGREARKILQSRSDFIAAIFKAVIPHISGPDLVRYMSREEHLRNIPVIMMSQARSIRISSESFAAGAAVLLPEPFSTSQVQNLIHMLAGAHDGANEGLS